MTDSFYQRQQQITDRYLQSSFCLWSALITVNRTARNFMADLNNELVLSVASLWEIAIKVSVEKLDLLRPFGELIPEQLQDNEITVLHIQLSHLAVAMESRVD